jgi:hypothetical protein
MSDSKPESQSSKPATSCILVFTYNLMPPQPRGASIYIDTGRERRELCFSGGKGIMVACYGGL